MRPPSRGWPSTGHHAQCCTDRHKACATSSDGHTAEPPQRPALPGLRPQGEGRPEGSPRSPPPCLGVPHSDMGSVGFAHRAQVVAPAEPAGPWVPRGCPADMGQLPGLWWGAGCRAVIPAGPLCGVRAGEQPRGRGTATGPRSRRALLPRSSQRLSRDRLSCRAGCGRVHAAERPWMWSAPRRGLRWVLGPGLLCDARLQE